MADACKDINTNCSKKKKISVKEEPQVCADEIFTMLLQHGDTRPDVSSSCEDPLIDAANTSTGYGFTMKDEYAEDYNDDMKKWIDISPISFVESKYDVGHSSSSNFNENLNIGTRKMKKGGTKSGSCLMAGKHFYKYKPEYLKYGFAEIKDETDGVSRALCVQCTATLANSSMKENKLIRHLTTKHPTLIDMPLSYWKQKEAGIKRMRMDDPSSTTMVFSSEKASLPSFQVSWMIARSKMPRDIAEQLVKPATVAMVKAVCGEEMANKIEMIPLSNSSIKRRIDLISEDILEQIIENIKKAENFAIQIDDSTDIADCSRLMVFVRYRTDETYDEEFLFCNLLSINTTGEDIFQMVKNFFNKYNLDWNNCSAVCADGGPSMWGSRVDFCRRVKEINPNVTIIHFFLHRDNLLMKDIQPDLYSVFTDAVNIANFIKNASLNTILIQKLCDEIGSDHQHLLFHSEIRWLSRGKVLMKIFEMRNEIEMFLREKSHAFADHFQNANWLAKLAYLSDIFYHFNVLDSSMQGINQTMVDTAENISSFKRKLDLWCQKMLNGKISAFPTLNSMLEDTSEITLDNLQTIIQDHLNNLQCKMNLYIPETNDLKSKSWIRNPFDVNVTECGNDINGFQEELIDLQENRILKTKFEQLPSSKFWATLQDKPILSKEAEKILLPFSTTCLCEAAFSALATINSNQRNILDPQHDLHCALAINVEPRLKKILKTFEYHQSL